MLRQFLPDVHACLVADLPRQAWHQPAERGLIFRLAFRREVRRVVEQHVDIHRRARRLDAVQMVPHAIAHEPGGNAPVRQREEAHGTKLFHCHGVFCDDAGDEGHGITLANLDGDNAELSIRTAL